MTNQNKWWLFLPKILILVIFSIIFTFPFVWMIITSLKTLPQVYTFPPVWIPKPIAWDNYLKALSGFFPFVTYLKNTLIIAGGVIIGEMLSASFVAYGFARFKFPGRNFWFLILIGTMMVPYVVRLVPLFLIFKKLGWINTFLPLIVPSYFGTPFYIFLLRQFFMTIPAELAEAARLDGCTEIGVWYRIFLPLSKPALAVVALFSLQYTWNDFLAPLIYINDNAKKTLTLGLYSIIGTSGAEQYWNYIMATAVTIVLPILIVFFIFQRFFTQGITLTGMKS